MKSEILIILARPVMFLIDLLFLFESRERFRREREDTKQSIRAALNRIRRK